jgi:hypothetical protein
LHGVLLHEETWISCHCNTLKFLFLNNFVSRAFWGQVWWLTSVIPATQDAETGRTAVQGQPRDKVRETPISRSKLHMMVHMCNPGYVRSIGRKIMVWLFSGRISLYAQVSLNYSPPICTSHCSWDDKHAPPYLVIG